MTEAQGTILVVEDEPEIRRFLRSSLGTEGYRVFEAANGERAGVAAESCEPDLAIVDLGLPDVDGVDVIRRIRRWSGMPIIVLSGHALEQTKVEALDAGADDYITKPFGINELLARIRAALRHSRSVAGNPTIELGDVVVDLAKHSVKRGTTEIRLTALESRVLTFLAQHLGMVVTHRQLLRAVWGPSRIEHNHYVRIYMKQLRDKLELDPVRPKYLLTHIGVGYRLVAEK